MCFIPTIGSRSGFHVLSFLPSFLTGCYAPYHTPSSRPANPTPLALCSVLSGSNIPLAGYVGELVAMLLSTYVGNTQWQILDV